MATKESIYNLALSKLLLARQVTNTATDNTSEVKNLNTHWDSALKMVLKDLNLDSTVTTVTLELIEYLGDSGSYLYVYKYPNSCLFFRRIVSGYEVDTRSTSILKKVGMYEGQKAIYTSKENAEAEIISKDLPLAAIDPNTENAIACQLAILAAPLLVGKGAQKLKSDLYAEYLIYKTDAQEGDFNENYNPEDEFEQSEYVAARLS